MRKELNAAEIEELRIVLSPVLFGVLEKLGHKSFYSSMEICDHLSLLVEENPTDLGNLLKERMKLVGYSRSLSRGNVLRKKTWIFWRSELITEKAAIRFLNRIPKSAPSGGNRW